MRRSFATSLVILISVTIVHKYVYNANERRVRSQNYDPYKLTGEATFTYNSFDEHGNWTARTKTPERPVNEGSWKTLEFRALEYYQ